MSPPQEIDKSWLSECFDCHGNTIDFESEYVKALPRDASATNYLVLQLSGRPRVPEREEFIRLNIFLEEAYGNNVWLVYHEASDFALILELPFVKRVIVYDSSFKIPAHFKNRLENRNEKFYGRRKRWSVFRIFLLFQLSPHSQ